MLKMRYILTAVLLCSSIAVMANDGKPPTDRCANEIGVDVANIVTFLSKKNDSYLLNYKRVFGKGYALRGNLNWEWSTAKDGYKSIGAKVGCERDLPSVSNWVLYYGLDASFLSRASNFQPNKATRYGLHPFVGVYYFFGKHFSLSTEMNLNFFYTDYRNPVSFDPADSKNTFDMNIGSVGMLLVIYHF